MSCPEFYFRQGDILGNLRKDHWSQIIQGLGVCQCAMNCSKNPLCVFFISNAQNCYLSSTDSSADSNWRIIFVGSPSNIIPGNIDTPFSQLTNSSVPDISSPEACIRDCQSRNSCFWVSYNIATKECFPRQLSATAGDVFVGLPNVTAASISPEVSLKVFSEPKQDSKPLDVSIILAICGIIISVIIILTIVYIKLRTRKKNQKANLEEVSLSDKPICNKHGVNEHACFISYRSSCDKTLALQLYAELESSFFDRFGRTLPIFMDLKCLKPGKNWELGLKDGIRGSRVILYLVSLSSLKIMESKLEDNQQDNVLLEIEEGLDLLSNGKVILLPLLVGQYDEFDARHKFKSFNYFDQMNYSHAYSGRFVADTMRDLFRNHGVDVDPENLVNVTHEVVRIIKEEFPQFIKS